MRSNDSMPTPLFSSPGVQNAVRALSSRGLSSGHSHFPRRAGWTGENVRVKVFETQDTQPTEVLRTWFKQLIGAQESARRRIDECSIEENIACVGALSWNARELSCCRIQTLVTEGGDLMSFYKGSKPNMRALYYRLELDAEIPGPMFTEPQPHLHTVPQGSPRCPFAFRSGEFLPLTFLEFIYLNHHPKKWLEWATQVVGLRNQKLDVSSIVQAYNDGKGRLWKNRSHFKPLIDEVRIILASAKREEARDEPAPSTEIQFMNYWPTTC